MSVQLSSNHVQSIHPHLVCTHFLLIVYAIGAPEAAASFELNQVNHEGQEINQVNQPDKRSLKMRSSALIMSLPCL